MSFKNLRAGVWAEMTIFTVTSLWELMISVGEKKKDRIAILFSLHAKKKTVASTKQIYYTFCSYKYILQLFWTMHFYNTLSSTFSNTFFQIGMVS